MSNLITMHFTLAHITVSPYPLHPEHAEATLTKGRIQGRR